MTRKSDDGRAPDGRFAKGTSGNVEGRPHKTNTADADAPTPLEKLLAITWPLTDQGQTRELTTEEALQHQTLKRALDGHRPSIRTVLKWIKKREDMRQKLRRKKRIKTSKPAPWVARESAGDRSDEALKLLGIASLRAQFPDPQVPKRLMIETWAAQAAIRHRRGLSELRSSQSSLIRSFVHNADDLKWPGDQDE